MLPSLVYVESDGKNSKCDRIPWFQLFALEFQPSTREEFTVFVLVNNIKFDLTWTVFETLHKPPAACLFPSVPRCQKFPNRLE